MANKYTDEYGRETADYIISTGKPINQVARELGLNAKTAQHWVSARRKQLEGGGEPENVSPELAEANRRIRELEMENEFLKKAAAFFARNQA